VGANPPTRSPSNVQGRPGAVSSLTVMEIIAATMLGASDDRLHIAAGEISDPMMTVITTIEVSLNQPYGETSQRLPGRPSAALSR
jgi:hypothetical protein